MRSHHDVLAMIEFRIGVESEAAGLAATRVTQTTSPVVRRDARQPYRSRARGCGRGGLRVPPRSRPGPGNRFYIDLLDSLGPMMIMLPRTRLDDAYSVRGTTHSSGSTEHENVADAILPAMPRPRGPQCGSTSATPAPGRSRPALTHQGRCGLEPGSMSACRRCPRGHVRRRRGTARAARQRVAVELDAQAGAVGTRTAPSSNEARRRRYVLGSSRGSGCRRRRSGSAWRRPGGSSPRG